MKKYQLSIPLCVAVMLLQSTLWGACTPTENDSVTVDGRRKANWQIRDPNALRVAEYPDALLQPRMFKQSDCFPVARSPLAPAYKPALNKVRLFSVSTGLVAANYFAYTQFKDIWWSSPKSDFHLYRGWRQTSGWYDFGFDDSLWHHIDKFGHFYNTRLLSLLLADTARWIGFEHKPSLWIGAAASWLFYLQIEFFDGQFEQWGFSLGDLAANSAGAFMPLLSHRYPFFSRLKMKLSYHRSQEFSHEQYMIEDYAGMTYWLSSNPRHFLPDWLDHYWPRFLNFALGYGVSQKAHGEIELYIALDYNFSDIKTKSPLVNQLLFYLDFLHFPSPAIKVMPSVESYLLYY